MNRSILCACVLVLGGFARAEDDPKALIAKAIKAHGGSEKLAAIKAEEFKYRCKSHFGKTVHDQTVHSQYEGAERWHEVSVSMVMEKPQRITTIVDGNTGRLETLINDQQLGYKVDEVWVAEQRERMFSRWVTTLQPFLNKEIDFKLTALGEKKVKNRTLIGVKVSRAPHRDVALYFDTVDGLLALVEYTVVHVSGKNDKDAKTEKYTLHLSNYKAYSGVMQATKQLLETERDYRREMELTEYKTLDKLDDLLKR